MGLTWVKPEELTNDRGPITITSDQLAQAMVDSEMTLKQIVAFTDSLGLDMQGAFVSDKDQLKRLGFGDDTPSAA